MARKPRIHLQGGVYHVMLRGNGGQDIFFDDEDRYHFYVLLQEGIARYHHRIHGFCLMTNHIHLAVQVGEEPLSKIVQNLSFRYTRWINRRLKRTGHLFQGRYKAILAEKEAYLLELVRYIHLNPVRAKLVRQPGAYPWSGHNAYLGKEELLWLETHWILSQFGKRLSTCREHYESFLREGRNEGYRAEFHRGGEDHRLLGDDKFMENAIGINRPVQSKLCIDDLIKPVCLAYQLTAKELASKSRNRLTSEARLVVGWLALKTDSVTLTQVGERFNRDVSTISRGVHRMEDKAAKNNQVAKLLRELYNTIMQA